MEKYMLNSPLQSEASIVSYLAEKVLNEALHTFQVEKLKAEIDEALCERNEEQFMKLTTKLNDLLKEEEN